MATRLALIPPLAHLDMGNVTGCSLLLAHLCKEPRYVEHYKQRVQEGDWLILDNSTYEESKSVADMAELLSICHRIGCAEVVVPDALMDPVENWAQALRAAAFLETGAGTHAWLLAGQPRLMIVPQIDPTRQTFDDWRAKASYLLDLFYGLTYLRRHLTLAITRDPGVLPGGLYELCEHAAIVQADFGCEVHMLGWPNKRGEMRDLVRSFPFIRSVDTAQPFVSAYARENLHAQDPPSKRQEGYFELGRLMPSQEHLARKNIEYLRDQLVV